MTNSKEKANLSNYLFSKKYQIVLNNNTLPLTQASKTINRLSAVDLEQIYLINSVFKLYKGHEHDDTSTRMDKIFETSMTKRLSFS